MCLCGRSKMFFSVFIVLGMLLLLESCTAPITVHSKPKACSEVVSVEIHNSSIWRPPVTHTDLYAGGVISTERGMSLSNGTVVVTIKSRPFTPSTDKNGDTLNTYFCRFYNILSSNFESGCHV